MSDISYWKETLSIAADECELSMTPEQLEYVASAVSGSHENYGLAFYEPSGNDRVMSIERDWQRRYDALQKEFKDFRGTAERVVRRFGNFHRDTPITITRDGRVETF